MIHVDAAEFAVKIIAITVVSSANSPSFIALRGVSI